MRDETIDELDADAKLQEMVDLALEAKLAPFQEKMEAWFKSESQSLSIANRRVQENGHMVDAQRIASLESRFAEGLVKIEAENPGNEVLRARINECECECIFSRSRLLSRHRAQDVVDIKSINCLAQAYEQQVNTLRISVASLAEQVTNCISRAKLPPTVEYDPVTMCVHNVLLELMRPYAPDK